MNIFARIAIVAVFVFAGYLYGLKYGFVAEGLIAGLFFGIVSIIIESRLRTVSFGSILGGLLGLGTGLIFANLMLLPLRYVITDEAECCLRLS